MGAVLSMERMLSLPALLRFCCMEVLLWTLGMSDVKVIELALMCIEQRCI